MSPKELHNLPISGEGKKADFSEEDADLLRIELMLKYYENLVHYNPAERDEITRQQARKIYRTIKGLPLFP